MYVFIVDRNEKKSIRVEVKMPRADIIFSFSFFLLFLANEKTEKTSQLNTAVEIENRHCSIFRFWDDNTKNKLSKNRKVKNLNFEVNFYQTKMPCQNVAPALPSLKALEHLKGAIYEI